MEVIKPEYLKKDPAYIKSIFNVTKGKTIVKERITLMFPERYLNKGLAYMGSVIKVIGIFAVISNGKYGVVIAPTMFNTTPMTIGSVVIDNKEYITLEYDKDQIFMNDNTLIKDDGVLYKIFDEFFVNGNIPWYVDYSILSKLLIESSKYAGSNIGNNPVIMELLTAIVTRDARNKDTYYRLAINDNKNKLPFTYVGLNDIFHSLNDTGSKVIGSYLKLGINSALVNKEKKATRVSGLLRS